MKMLSTALLAIALFTLGGQPAQAEVKRTPLGASTSETRAGDSVHKRRYYGRVYVDRYNNYRPYAGYRPFYPRFYYNYRPYWRPNYYYGPSNYYFGTGAYRYYPYPYYGNVYYY
jgi:hypothetical protein